METRRGAPAWLLKAKRRAKRLKRQVWALYLAMGDPGTPVLAKVVIACAIAYAVSPIDLLPDFIPVLGYLDELLVLPALIALALRLIPPPIAARCRREAWRRLASGERVKTKSGIVASILFVAVWLSVLAWLASLFL